MGSMYLFKVFRCFRVLAGRRIALVRERQATDWCRRETKPAKVQIEDVRPKFSLCRSMAWRRARRGRVPRERYSAAEASYAGRAARGVQTIAVRLEAGEVAVHKLRLLLPAGLQWLRSL